MMGVAYNYSTHLNEKMHGTLKAAYAGQSNSKDVVKQVCTF